MPEDIHGLIRGTRYDVVHRMDRDYLPVARYLYIEMSGLAGLSYTPYVFRPSSELILEIKQVNVISYGSKR